MRRMYCWIMFVLGLLVTTMVYADNQAAITIFTAKKVITMDPVDTVATAVAVKDGRIYSVGTLKNMQTWMKPGTYTVNKQFANDVITPGLIEPHTHFSMLAVFMAHPYVGYWDFPGANGTVVKAAKTREEVLQHLKDADQQLKDPNAVLFAWGYDPIYFNNNDLTAKDLDTVSKTRPIFVLNASMHIGYVNSVLLNRVAYTKSTMIKGVQKDKDGNPTGVLEEMEAAGPVIMSFYGQLISPTSYKQQLYTAADIAHRQGVTTVADMLFGGPGEDIMIDVFKNAANDDAYPVRMLFAYNGPLLFMKEQKQPGSGVAYIQTLMKNNSEKLYFGPVKFISDGSIQGFTSRIDWPGYFNGAPNGLFNMTADQMKAAALPFWKAGLPIHIHVNGDQAGDATLDTLQYLQTMAPSKSNIFVLEHNQMATPEQYQRIHDLGAYVDLFPNHIYYWGDQHYSILLGPDRASRINDPVDAKRYGVLYGFHTDSPVTPLGPLHTMWAAMNRLTASGRVLGAQSRINADEALRAVTLNAAYLLGLQKDIGSIEIGKRADFTVLGRDPLVVSAPSIKDIPVIATVQDGRVSAIR